jgi:hypothetical protein
MFDVRCLGINSAFRTFDAFAIFNILTMLGVNTYGQKRKNILSCCLDGQYPIIFEGYLTVRQ